MSCVEDKAGRLMAVAPCYVKGNSMGEYVFDHAWADAYQRAGLDYYPKLPGLRAVHAGHGPPPARRRPTPSRTRATR